MPLTYLRTTHLGAFQSGLLDEETGSKSARVLKDASGGLKTKRLARFFCYPNLAHPLNDRLRVVRFQFKCASQHDRVVNVCITIFECEFISTPDVNVPLPVHDGNLAGKLTDVPCPAARVHAN